MISSPVLVSRFPVGSSASRITGRLTRARAIAARCCSPPESSVGDASRALRGPRDQRLAHARGRSPRGNLRQAQRQFNIFLQRHSRQSWKDWKTIPIVCCGGSPVLTRTIAARSRPCARIAPEDGRSSPAIKFSSVDCPIHSRQQRQNSSGADFERNLVHRAISASPIL